MCAVCALLTFISINGHFGSCSDWNHVLPYALRSALVSDLQALVKQAKYAMLITQQDVVTMWLNLIGSGDSGHLDLG